MASIQVETVERHLELGGLPPHVEEHLAGQVFGDRTFADEAQDEAEDADLMPGETAPACVAVTLRDPFDEGRIMRGARGRARQDIRLVIWRPGPRSCAWGVS